MQKIYRSTKKRQKKYKIDNKHMNGGGNLNFCDYSVDTNTKPNPNPKSGTGPKPGTNPKSGTGPKPGPKTHKSTKKPTNSKPQGKSKKPTNPNSKKNKNSSIKKVRFVK